jgi:GNAT superfamily N-acetyltransferase
VHPVVVIIRRRAHEDLPGCLRTLDAVHVSDRYPTLWPADPAAWLTPDGYAAGWVAEEAGKAGVIIGHVCAVRGIEDPVVTSYAGVTSQQLASVSRLFVAGHARGRGVGTSLLTAVRLWAHDHGLELMLDVVESDAPALALYERLGWRRVDRRKAAWTTPEGERPWLRIYLGPA